MSTLLVSVAATNSQVMGMANINMLNTKLDRQSRPFHRTDDIEERALITAKIEQQTYAAQVSLYTSIANVDITLNNLAIAPNPPTPAPLLGQRTIEFFLPPPAPLSTSTPRPKSNGSQIQSQGRQPGRN